MSLKNTKWQSFESQVSLDQAAMDRVERLAEASIKARGQFHLVLAGGSTPKNTHHNKKENKLYRFSTEVQSPSTLLYHLESRS